jgi:hypothetical protein
MGFAKSHFPTGTQHPRKKSTSRSAFHNLRFRWRGYLTGPGDQVNTGPLLGPLQDNGGPAFTHALLPGSPAINAGHPNFTPPPSYDQRRSPFVRVFNRRPLGHLRHAKRDRDQESVIGKSAQPCRESDAIASPETLEFLSFFIHVILGTQDLISSQCLTRGQRIVVKAGAPLRTLAYEISNSHLLAGHCGMVSGCFEHRSLRERAGERHSVSQPRFARRSLR